MPRRAILRDPISVRAGLVSRWTMRARDGGAFSIRDSIGAFDAALTAPSSITSGQIKQGLSFDGTTSKAVAAARLYPQTGYTAMLWAKITSLALTRGLIQIWSSASPANAYSQFLVTNGGAVIGRIFNSSVSTNFIGRTTASSTITINILFHIAFTWDGGAAASGIKVYVNGSAADNADSNSGTFTGPYTGNDVPLWIGAQKNGGGDSFLPGTIEDARIYDRPLTAGEVNLIYRRGLVGLS